jgi:hypothetical protein
MEHKVGADLPSPWAHPVTFAGKGEVGACAAAWTIVRQRGDTSQRGAFPRMDDLIDSVHGIQVMSSLHLAAGYHQIPCFQRNANAPHSTVARPMEFTVKRRTKNAQRQFILLSR